MKGRQYVLLLGGEVSTATTDVEKPVKPRLWVRLRSWKWWVFGVVNPRPFAHPREGWAKGFVLGVAVWLLLWVQPWICTWINRHPPPLSQLEKVNGEVIYTSRKSPHLGIRTDTGKIIKMEYPVVFTVYGSVAGGTRSLGSYNEKSWAVARPFGSTSPVSRFGSDIESGKSFAIPMGRHRHTESLLIPGVGSLSCSFLGREHFYSCLFVFG